MFSGITPNTVDNKVDWTCVAHLSFSFEETSYRTYMF